jgi:hypothetical protein
MAGHAEATQVSGLGEDQELRKQNGSRIQSRNNNLVKENRFSDQKAKTVVLGLLPCAAADPRNNEIMATLIPILSEGLLEISKEKIKETLE